MVVEEQRVESKREASKEMAIAVSGPIGAKEYEIISICTTFFV